MHRAGPVLGRCLGRDQRKALPVFGEPACHSLAGQRVAPATACSTCHGVISMVRPHSVRATGCRSGFLRPVSWPFSRRCASMAAAAFPVCSTRSAVERTWMLVWRLSSLRVCRAVLAMRPPAVSARSGRPGTVVRRIGAHTSAHGVPACTTGHTGPGMTNGDGSLVELPTIRTRQRGGARVPSCRGMFEWMSRAVMPRRSDGGGHGLKRASRRCCTGTRTADGPVPGGVVW